MIYVLSYDFIYYRVLIKKKQHLLFKNKYVLYVFQNVNKINILRKKKCSNQKMINYPSKDYGFFVVLFFWGNYVLPII